MKIKKVTGVYFSAVGNTRKIVEMLTEQVASACHVRYDVDDFTLPQSRDHTRSFDGKTLVVFGTPTYAGRVPNKVLPLIQELFDGAQTPALPVVTFGNRNFDSALTELRNELQNQGFIPFAAAAFSCRHVFSNTLAAGRPDEEDLAALHQFGHNAVQILWDASDPEALPAVIIRDGAPVAPYYIPKGTDGKPVKFLKAKPKTDLSRCDDCRICAAVCPMGSIDRDQIAEVPGICIKCQACVRKCPKGAKYFDDPAFLSHVAMLEQNFMRRAEPELFFGSRQDSSALDGTVQE